MFHDLAVLFGYDSAIAAAVTYPKLTAMSENINLVSSKFYAHSSSIRHFPKGGANLS